MRCVSIKTVEQADLQAVHRPRSLFVKHRTAVINQIRGLLAEYGLVMGQSPEKVRPALVRFLDDAASGLTVFARETFSELYAQLTERDARIERVTHRVERVYRAHPVCQQLAAVAGDWSVDGHRAGGDRRSTSGVSQRPASGGLVGPGASAIFQWRQGAVRRDFETGESVCADAADSWGARRRATGRGRTDTQGRWLWALKCRKGTHVAAAALANKNARVVWALLARDDVDRRPA
jgi:transposase